MFKLDMFGLEKNGSFKVWSINVKDTPEGGEIAITHGKENGTLTTKVELVTKGKQGRTPVEQAMSQAEGRIKKQKDKGYREDKNDLFNLPVIAMLAKDASGGKGTIDYSKGVYLSDKLDGVRCLAHCLIENLEKVIKLESRTGQPYSVPHIEAELYNIMEPGDILDGEIYVHGDQLQDITSATKRTDAQSEIDKTYTKAYTALAKYGPESDQYIKAVKDHDDAIKIANIRERLEFRVFDIASKHLHGTPFMGRLIILQNYAKDRFVEGGKVFLVQYEYAENEMKMLELHDDAIARGFEGIMIRTLDGLYESGKRSSGLWKYKVFKDGEFLIVGISADKDGYGVFNLLNDIKNDVTGEYDPFTCVMGTMAERLEQLQNMLYYVDKYLKVKYQSRYAVSNLPQFGTGVMVREGTVVDGVFVPSE